VKDGDRGCHPHSHSLAVAYHGLAAGPSVRLGHIQLSHYTANRLGWRSELLILEALDGTPA